MDQDRIVWMQDDWWPPGMKRKRCSVLAFDTETTGLYLQNGSTTFAIGCYDGESFRSSVVFIEPTTRMRLSPLAVKSIRSEFDKHDFLIAHNANFDIKALCEAGVYDWSDPTDPAFWRRIVDTTFLSHMYCSVDQRSLDSLTQKYLNRGYPEDDELVAVVKKCRTLVRKIRKDWIIADERFKPVHAPFLPCSSSNDWVRMDFWLPMAVCAGIPANMRPDLPDDVLTRVMLRYLKADCINTYDLFKFFLAENYARYEDKIDEVSEINNQVRHVVWKMETEGLWVRSKELDNAIAACESQISTLDHITRELSGIDHITDAKLRVLLFTQWGLDTVKQTKKGGDSVDAGVLLKLHNDAVPGSPAHRFLCCLLSKRKYEKKLASLLSYKNSRSTSGYVHPSFNTVGTATTRFSSNNPNAQNITKAGNPYEEDAPDIAEWLQKSPSMRSVFGPPPGKWWISADYSQLQLRIFAVITQEQDMIDAFDRGWDAHDFVARRIFAVQENEKPTKAQRRVAKNVNFGFIFGASPRKIEATAGIDGLWNTVLALFPNAHAFIQATKEDIRQTGHVETIGGYKLEIRDMFNIWSGRYEKAAHAGVNYLVQGAEGVIVKRAMALCDEYLRNEFPYGRIVLQVHDELVFEMPAKFPKKHAYALADCMMAAAKHYGIVAPVDPELILGGWDKSVQIIPF